MAVELFRKSATISIVSGIILVIMSFFIVVFIPKAFDSLENEPEDFYGLWFLFIIVFLFGSTVIWSGYLLLKKSIEEWEFRLNLILLGICFLILLALSIVSAISIPKNKEFLLFIPFASFIAFEIFIIIKKYEGKSRGSRHKCQ